MNDQSSHVSEEDRLSEEERKDKKAAQMTGAQAVPPEQEEEESENDDSTGNGGLLKKTCISFSLKNLLLQDFSIMSVRNFIFRNGGCCVSEPPAL